MCTLYIHTYIHSQPHICVHIHTIYICIQCISTHIYTHIYTINTDKNIDHYDGSGSSNTGIRTGAAAAAALLRPDSHPCRHTGTESSGFSPGKLSAAGEKPGARRGPAAPGIHSPRAPPCRCRTMALPRALPGAGILLPSPRTAPPPLYSLLPSIPSFPPPLCSLPSCPGSAVTQFCVTLGARRAGGFEIARRRRRRWR